MAVAQERPRRLPGSSPVVGAEGPRCGGRSAGARHGFKIPASSAKGKDDQVAEADALSEVGGVLRKKEAVLRLNRMVKLLKKVEKEQGTAKEKQLDEILSALRRNKVQR